MSYLTNLITDTETAIKLLDPKIQNTHRHLATKKLKQIINTNSNQTPKHTRQVYIMKQMNEKHEKGNAIITQTDKSKSIVVINTDDYNKKVHTFL
jgi:hypothetical protein